MRGMTGVSVEHPGEGQAVVSFQGEHDSATAKEISELMHWLIADNRLVVADVSETEFIDSSFVNVLFTAQREASARGHIFRVQVATSALVRRVFEIMSIFESLDCVATREEALREEPEP